MSGLLDGGFILTKADIDKFDVSESRQLAGFEELFRLSPPLTRELVGQYSDLYEYLKGHASDGSTSEAILQQEFLVRTMWHGKLMELCSIQESIQQWVEYSYNVIFDSNATTPKVQLSILLQRLESNRVMASLPVLTAVHRYILHYETVFSTILTQLNQVESWTRPFRGDYLSNSKTKLGSKFPLAVRSMAHLLFAVDGQGILLHEFTNEMGGKFPLGSSTARVHLIQQQFKYMTCFAQYRTAGLVVYSQVTDGDDSFLSLVLTYFNAFLLLSTIEANLGALNGESPNPLAFKNSMDRLDQFLISLLQKLGADLPSAEDVKMDELAGKVTRLAAVSTSIDAELQKQQEILASLDEKVDMTSKKPMGTAAADKQTRDLLTQTLARRRATSESDEEADNDAENGGWEDERAEAQPEALASAGLMESELASDDFAGVELNIPQQQQPQPSFEAPSPSFDSFSLAPSAASISMAPPPPMAPSVSMAMPTPSPLAFSGPPPPSAARAPAPPPPSGPPSVPLAPRPSAAPIASKLSSIRSSAIATPSKPSAAAISASVSASVSSTSAIEATETVRSRRVQSKPSESVSSSSMKEEKSKKRAVKKKADRREMKEEADEEAVVEVQMAPITAADRVPMARKSEKIVEEVEIPSDIRSGGGGGGGGGGEDEHGNLMRGMQLESIKGIMLENIDQTLQRGDQLESLQEKSLELEAASLKFHKAAKKQKGFLSGLFSRDKTKKPKKKKKKTKIDNVFADIENTFNGLSALLARVTYFKKLNVCCPVDGCWIALISLPIMFLTYFGVSLFTLIILLPAVFLLLLVRTQTIERKVETGFVVRQQVLAQETVQEKSLRFISLMLRALPMAAFLIGWPIFSVYYLIPKYRHEVWIDIVTVGAFLVIMLILQILGTIRSARSFLEKMKAAHLEKVEAWNKRMEGKSELQIIQPVVKVEYDEDGNEIPSTDKRTVIMPSSPLPPTFFSDTFQSSTHFRFKNIHNQIALITLLIEAAQLIMFAVQTLDADTMQANRAKVTVDPQTTDNSVAGGGHFGPKFFPFLFINVANYLSNNIVYVYAYVSCGVVALLLIVFLAQFMKELLNFATAPSKQEANDVFFHSFIGSIVYGHGEVKHVSSTVSNVVALLSDTLFLIICGKLMAVFTCITPTDTEPALLLIDPTVVCWEGDHQFLAVISLIAFAYYLPLSTMISPMLVESDDTVDLPPNADGSAPPVRPPRKKDVNFVQPFLSLLIVSKCFLLIVSSFFGHNNAIVTVVASMFVSSILLFVTCFWISRSYSSLFRSQRWYLDRAFTSHPHMHIKPPCSPDSINIIRILSFTGGVLGSIVAILAYVYPRELGGDTKFYVLAVVAFVLLLIGLIWRFHTRIPLIEIMKDMLDDASTEANSPRAVRISIAPDLNDDLPEKSSGGGGLLGNPAFIRSSSSETAIEMEQLPTTANNSSRMVYTEYRPAEVTMNLPPVAPPSAAAAATAPPRSLVNISAVQGMEFIDGLWRIRNIMM